MSYCVFPGSPPPQGITFRSPTSLLARFAEVSLLFRPVIQTRIIFQWLYCLESVREKRTSFNYTSPLRDILHFSFDALVAGDVAKLRQRVDRSVRWVTCLRGVFIKFRTKRVIRNWTASLLKVALVETKRGRRCRCAVSSARLAKRLRITIYAFLTFTLSTRDHAARGRFLATGNTILRHHRSRISDWRYACTCVHVITISRYRARYRDARCQVVVTFRSAVD